VLLRIAGHVSRQQFSRILHSGRLPVLKKIIHLGIVLLIFPPEQPGEFVAVRLSVEGGVAEIEVQKVP
jgi:hypothetical protein